MHKKMLIALMGFQTKDCGDDCFGAIFIWVPNDWKIIGHKRELEYNRRISNPSETK